MYKMTEADKIYLNLLNQINLGDVVIGRNGNETLSGIGLHAVFTSFPLVTLRKTAWKMALREMEWFLSGEDTCPEELLPWWRGQLGVNNTYTYGYAHQFRNFNYSFDQINHLRLALINHPSSRRLILSAWNAEEMERICIANGNVNTPTTCHNTITQFFVRNDVLHMTTYQRSADMIIGVPHNWVQSWALLVYLARMSSLEVGSLHYIFGDAHVYMEKTHLEVLDELLKIYDKRESESVMLELGYSGYGEFLASDFKIKGNIPEPTILTKPVRT